MGLEKIGIFGATAVVAFAAVVGCGVDTKPVESPSAVTTSAAASDEQQIRDVIKREEAALADLDFDKIIALSCTKYRDLARKQRDTLVPPMTDFLPAGQPAGSVAELAAAVKQEFPAASDVRIDRVADALARGDEAAYHEAVMDLKRETESVTVDKVENITITGDTATADITSTWTEGDTAPETVTHPNAFLKEDGEWRDCEPPDV